MNVEIRAIKTPAEQALSDAYLAARGNCPATARWRHARGRFRAFDARGLPHRRVEEWKYTDLRALMRDALPLAVAAGRGGKAARQRCRQAVLRRRGAPAGALSMVSSCGIVRRRPEAGISRRLDGAGAGQGRYNGARQHVGKTIETDDVAVALNTALMGDGAVIRIAAGTMLKRPIHLVFARRDAELGLHPFAGSGREGRAGDLDRNHAGGASQVNAALELVIGDAAQVDHVRLTQRAPRTSGTLMASLGAGANFTSFSFTADATLVRNQMFVRFAGEGTKAAIRGVSLLKGKEHVDTTLLIDHAAGHCESREVFRTVLDGESRGVFQGKIVVRPHAQKTDAKMMTRALLLSEEAEADNKPELEIFADDVVCGHGATTAAPDEGLKFYLMSRGIPEKEAEALLIQAFVDDAIEAIGHQGIREALLFAALKWLGARG